MGPEKNETDTEPVAAWNYPKSGIYLFLNEGVCFWFDFTKMKAAFSGQTNCEIKPCHSYEFPSPVMCPSFSVLDKTRIKDVLGARVSYWTDSLRQCVKRMGLFLQND